MLSKKAIHSDSIKVEEQYRRNNFLKSNFV